MLEQQAVPANRLLATFAVEFNFLLSAILLLVSFLVNFFAG
jgi:hypothetical protein